MRGTLETGQLYPHPNNPRMELGDLTELAESIKKRGILQNLTVVPREQVEALPEGVEEFTQFTVVIGHRRLAAAKLAGLTALPCTIEDMDPREQLETMLMENVQRSDLTVFEQAQGFKSLFDLGASVESIAEKTGFGETTIRRRLKIAELDRDKLIKASARQATMEDYERLSKIRDLKKRNELLEKIGTHNFDWCVSTAITEQTEADVKRRLIPQLKKFAKKISTSDTYGPKYKEVKSWPLREDDGKDIMPPKDADKTEYFFAEFYGAISLYRLADKEKSAEEEQAFFEEKERKARVKQLDAVAEQAYKRRKEFVINISCYRKDAQVIRCALWLLASKPYYSINAEDIYTYAGMPERENGNGLYLKKEEIHGFLNIGSKALLAAAYAAIDDSKRNRSHSGYDGGFSESAAESLSMLYMGLKELGYELSDEEAAYIDGTHELFQTAK